MERGFKTELRRLNRTMSRVRNIQTGRLDKVPTPTFIDLLLKHGRLYSPQPLLRGLRRGAPKNCFYNAWRIAQRECRFSYAEGYVVSADLHILIHHGFLVDETGAFECTLKKPANVYFGMEFNTTALITTEGCQAIGDETEWLCRHRAALQRWEQARI